MSDEIRMLYITAKDMEEAKRIGRHLVENRLAACVNILPNMQSIYWWEGKIQEDKETVIIAKTRKGLVDSVTEAVKSMHSYTTPCVIPIPISEGGNEAYRDWLLAETSGESESQESL